MVTNEQAPYGAVSERVSDEPTRDEMISSLERLKTWPGYLHAAERNRMFDAIVKHLRSLGSSAEKGEPWTLVTKHHITDDDFDRIIGECRNGTVHFDSGDDALIAACLTDLRQRLRSPPPVEARAVGMTESEREALKQAAEFIQPGFMPNNLPTGRCYEIAATLRALSTRLASGGEEDARLKDARKTIEEAYAFASPSYEAAANVDALECVSAKLEAWLNANPLAALPADKGE